jgi:malonyl-CoA O-methyltransferase
MQGPERVTDFESLSTQSRGELLERLQFFKLEPQVVVDLGSGPGIGTTELRRKFRGAQLIAIDADFANALAARRRQRFWSRCDALCADACTLPLRAQSVDLVVSNMLLPHCPSPPRVFAQLQRVLRPGGLVVFSTLGPGALQHVRCRRADAFGLDGTANDFDMPRLGAAMSEAGLAEPVLDCERLVLGGQASGIEIIYGAAFGGGGQGVAPGGGTEYSVPLARFRRRKNQDNQ